MQTGIELIAKERNRQVTEEGWSTEHDDMHEDGELALVAALYATPQPLYTLSVNDGRNAEDHHDRGVAMDIDDPWPSTWSTEWDKRGKHSRLRQLVIAGALIAAEIDRLLRAGVSMEVYPLNWREEIDDMDNSTWEAPSPYEDDQVPFMWRLKPRISENRIEWYECHDLELMDMDEIGGWPTLEEAKAAIAVKHAKIIKAERLGK